MVQNVQKQDIRRVLNSFPGNHRVCEVKLIVKKTNELRSENDAEKPWCSNLKCGR